MFKLHKRRGEIIYDNLAMNDLANNGQRSKWLMVKWIHNRLGAEGMSSDETECEETFRTSKVTRRIAKGWIHTDLSRLWTEVDRCYNSRRPNGRRRMGRKSIRREILAHKINDDSRVVIALPPNFYAEDFLAELSARQRRDLRISEDRKDDVDIPHMEC